MATKQSTETHVEYDANAIIPVIEKFHEPKPIDIHKTELVAIPKGLELHSTKHYRDELLEHPERREGTARFTTLNSFCNHVNRFKNEHSALFADESMENPSLLSVLDYHDKGAAGTPRFAAHRGFYPFPLSDEWKAWKAQDGKQLSQTQFAQLLEDRVVDVLDPAAVGEAMAGVAGQVGITLASPSRLLTLARGLTVRVDSKVVNATNLSTGEGELTYEEVHREKDGGAPLKVPNGFVIGLPVFRAGDGFQVLVRLRYRVANGHVQWIVALHRVDVVFRRAFEESCTKAQDQTELPLFYGTPE